MDLIITAFALIVLLFSVVIHELAHGSVAYSLGDLTAKYQGRLTLNPLKHLDVFGSVILPLLLAFSYWTTGIYGPIIGWAKPVPINPYNFKDQKWGSLKVAVAGPLSNIALAILFGLLIRFVPTEIHSLFTRDNFNIVDYIIRINIALALFNLIPIPPLDGHWILFTFIPNKLSRLRAFLQQYGIFVLIFLIFFGGLNWLFRIVEYLFRLITGI